jgi:sulfur carrier protein
MKINGKFVVSRRCLVTQLLIDLELPAKGVAVAVNGEVVRRSEWETRYVEPDDEVEVLTAAAGG